MTVRDFRTPLAKVEGLGAARAGTLHFWHQRMTAVALVPLSIWFVASALAYVGAAQGAVAAYFAEPVNAAVMFLFILASTYHMSLGVQIIIEDYFHHEGQKIAAHAHGPGAGGWYGPPPPDWATAWHRFTIERRSNYVAFGVDDDVKVRFTAAMPSTPMAIALDTKVGFPWAEGPDATTPDPVWLQCAGVTWQP